MSRHSRHHQVAELRITASFGGSPPPLPDLAQPGTPEHEVRLRRNAAQLVKEIRAMWSTLKGEWSRTAWNAQARRAGRNYLKNLKQFILVDKQ